MYLLRFQRILNVLSIGKLPKSKITSVGDSSCDGILSSLCWSLDNHIVRRNPPSFSAPVTSFDLFMASLMVWVESR